MMNEFLSLQTYLYLMSHQISIFELMETTFKKMLLEENTEAEKREIQKKLTIVQRLLEISSKLIEYDTLIHLIITSPNISVDIVGSFEINNQDNN